MLRTNSVLSTSPLISHHTFHVFQLAGGRRDYYTSRAEFILLAKANSNPDPAMWMQMSIGRGHGNPGESLS